MDTNNLIDVGVKEAQRRYLNKPLEVGRTAAIPSEPVTCAIEEILPDGQVVIGWAPKGIRHTVDAAELFDPNDALVLAFVAQANL